MCMAGRVEWCINRSSEYIQVGVEGLFLHVHWRRDLPLYGLFTHDTHGSARYNFLACYIYVFCLAD